VRQRTEFAVVAGIWIWANLKIQLHPAATPLQTDQTPAKSAVQTVETALHAQKAAPNRLADEKMDTNKPTCQ
jgi:hypothetical protein